MMLRLTKGTSVVSRADGATSGAIERVCFDPERRAEAGINFQEWGWLVGGPSGPIETADVHAVGLDVMSIADASVVRREVAMAVWHGALLDLEALLQRTVITVGGRRLGQVSAIEFSPVTYRLIALTVAAAYGTRAMRITAHAIYTIGEESIVVVDHAAARQGVVRPRRLARVLPFPPSSAIGSWTHEPKRISA